MANVAGAKRIRMTGASRTGSNTVGARSTAEIRMRDSAGREPFHTRWAHRDTVAGRRRIGGLLLFLHRGPLQRILKDIIHRFDGDEGEFRLRLFRHIREIAPVVCGDEDGRETCAQCSK